MSSPVVGEAFVTIRPDFSRFERDLKKALRGIEPNLDAFEKKLNKSLAAIKPDTSNISDRINRSINTTKADTSGFAASLDQSLKEVEPNTSTLERKLNRSLIGAQPDISNFSRSLDRSLRSLDVDTSSLEGRLKQSLGSVDPDLSGLQRNINRSIGRVSPDTTSFSERIERAFERVGESTDKLERRTRILGSTLTRLGVGSGLAVLISQASALTGALLPVTGLLAAIPGLAASAGAGIGTLFVGFSGVGDALKESFKDVSGGAAAATVDTTSLQRSVEAASRGITSAQRDVKRAFRDVGDASYGVEQASRSLLATQKDALDLELALTNARERATEALASYQDQIRGASLTQERAELSLLDARKRLIDLTKKGVKEEFFETYLTETEDTRKELEKLTEKEVSDSLDVRKAKLDIQEAEYRLQQVIKDGVNLQKIADKAQLVGVEGSSEVVAAKERVAEATERVADANHALVIAQRDVSDSNLQIVDAQEQVILANQQLEDAIASLQKAQEKQAGATSKAADALAKLSPNARSAVQAILSLRDEYNRLKNDVQDRIFAGIDKEILQLANSSFPTLNRGLGLVADSFNRVFQASFDAAQTPFFQDRAAQVFEGTAKSIDVLGKSVEPLILGLINLAAVAEPFLVRFAEFSSDALTKFGNFLASEKGARKMTAALEKAGKVAHQLLNIAINLGKAFSNVFSAADSGKFLESVEKITAKFAEFTASAEGQETLKQLFESLGRSAEAFGDILPNVIEIVGKVLEAFNSLPEPVKDASAEFFALSLVLGPLFSGLATLSVAGKGLLSIFGLLSKGPINLFQKLFPKALEETISKSSLLGKEIGNIESRIAGIQNSKLQAALSGPIPEAKDRKAMQVFDGELKSLQTKLDDLTKKKYVIDTEVKYTNAAEEAEKSLKKAGVQGASGFLSGFGSSLALRFAPAMAAALAPIAALLANPIFWIAIGVVAAGFLIYAFRDELKNFFTVALPTFYEEQKPKVLQFFKDLPGNIGEALGNLTGKLISKAADLMRGFDDGKRIAWEGEDGKGGIKGFFTNLGDSVVTAVGDLTQKLIQKGKDILTGFFTGIGLEWDTKKTFWSNLGNNIVLLITNPQGILENVGREIVKGLFSGAKKEVLLAVNLAELYVTTRDALQQKFNDVGEWLLQAGKDFIGGFIKGIRETLKTDDAKKVVTEVANFFTGGLIDKLDSHSPSRETMKIGAFAAQGFLIGIQSLNKEIGVEASNIAGLVTNGLAVTSPTFSASVGSLRGVNGLGMSSSGVIVQKNYNLTLAADYTTSADPEENFRRMELLSLPYDLSGV